MKIICPKIPDHYTCLSLRSKKARITNEWKIEKEYIGSNRSDPFNSEFEVELSDTDKQLRLIINNDFGIEYSNFKKLNGSNTFEYLIGTGSWEFTDGGFGAYSPTEESLSEKEGLHLIFENGFLELYKIERLTKRELWIFCYEPGGIYGPIGHGLKLIEAK